MKIVGAALAMFLGVVAASGAQEAPLPEPHNVLSWPRAPVDRFGCMLEREFETRHPRFNCGLRGYVNRSDACAITDAYYEGPQFPADKAGKVLPQIDRIEIASERGQVQAVTLILKQRQTQTAIRALLGLPSPRAMLPVNISSVDIQGCRPEGASQVCNVVLIEGFDHRGAGDVDCGEEGVQPEPTPQPGAAPASEKD